MPSILVKARLGFNSKTFFFLMLPLKMRTVLCRICLLIDDHQIVRQHFISNGNGGEESKIEESV